MHGLSQAFGGSHALGVLPAFPVPLGDRDSASSYHGLAVRAARFVPTQHRRLRSIQRIHMEPGSSDISVSSPFELPQGKRFISQAVVSHQDAAKCSQFLGTISCRQLMQTNLAPPQITSRPKLSHKTAGFGSSQGVNPKRHTCS